MNLNEALHLLAKWSREELQRVITDGVELPRSRRVVRIAATRVGEDYDISDQSLQDFLAVFEAEEPGRWPPVAVRRALLVEAGHRCAICEDSAPAQFHHIVEFNRLGHHDRRHMIAICGTCHHKCTIGMIDRRSQEQYKEKLNGAGTTSGVTAVAPSGPVHLTLEAPARFSWDDLKDVIGALHGSLHASSQPGESRFDFFDVTLEEKNAINGLGPAYFAEMRTAHEPYFGRIRDFLRNPVNQEVVAQYHEVVDELRTKIAVDRAQFGSFEQVLTRFADVAVHNAPGGLRGQRRALNILLSFMYFNCDVGRKR